MLLLKLKESIQHWIARDRSHQHEMCCCTSQVCSTMLSLWNQSTYLNPGFLKLFLVLLNPCPSLFSWYKYTEGRTNLHLPEDNPAIRKAKLLCNGNWLAKLQEAGNTWKTFQQCKQNKLCHTRLWQDCVHKQLPQTSNLKVTHEPWS